MIVELWNFDEACIVILCYTKEDLSARLCYVNYVNVIRLLTLNDEFHCDREQRWYQWHLLVKGQLDPLSLFVTD